MANRDTQSTDGATGRENGIAAASQNAARTRQDGSGRENGARAVVPAASADKTRLRAANRVSRQAYTLFAILLAYAIVLAWLGPVYV